MDRLSRDPRNFRELVEADLRRAARLVIKVQDEIDPQIRIATPEGDYWIAVTLPKDEYARKVIFRNLALFMAWKQALGFTLASEFRRTVGESSEEAKAKQPKAAHKMKIFWR